MRVELGLIELITLRGSFLAALPITSGRRRSRSNSCATRRLTDCICCACADQGRLPSVTDALGDVDRAEQLSLEIETINRERSAIFQALGRYDEALAIREEAADRRASFENVAALVGLYAERGQIDTADDVRGKPPSVSRRLTVSAGASRFPVGSCDEHGRLGDARMSSTPRDAVSRPTRRRKAISPRSKQN